MLSASRRRHGGRADAMGDPMLHKTVPAVGLSVLLGLGTLLIATPAQAASTGEVAVGTYLEFKAASGKKNKLVVSRSGDKITFDDAVSLKAGKGCKAVSGHKTVVACTVHNPGTVVVTLGDKNDSFTSRTDLRFNVYGGSGDDKLTGGAGAEMLDGGTGKDKLYGNAGADQLRGRSGNDLLDAGDGDDSLAGGDGNDTLVGRAGNDQLWGDAGEDVYWAGAGNDRMQDGKKSEDVFHGGTGSDEVSYIGRSKAIVADADGRSRDDGESGEHDTIDADVERLVGGEGSDRLTGNASNNFLSGSGGNDVLVGLGGDDDLTGWTGKDTMDSGDGDDWLDGGPDADTMSGGAGADVIAGRDGLDKISGGAGNDRLYGWEIEDGGPPSDPDGEGDMLGGNLDGGPDDDLCVEGARGTKTNCES
jgi:serralysin